MKPLNLEKALQLYTIIGKHLPENPEIDMEIIDFVGTIVDSIVEQEEHPILVQSIVLMSGMQISDVRMLEIDHITKLFVEGLLINRVTELKEFCKSLD